MGRTIITTDKAPAPVGPYSQGVLLEDDLLFLSGQLGVDPGTGVLAEGVEAQARQAMANVRAVIQAAGGTLASILKTTIFLTDMQDFKTVNTVYAACFKEAFPARSCVQVAALPLGACVEIECIARV